jgi:uncharacterized membrane protein
MVVAMVCIFIAIIFGQFEAGLAESHGAVQSVLNLHNLISWSLAVIIFAMTTWRFMIRRRDLSKVPNAYLAIGL